MIRLQEGRDTEVISGLCLYRADREEWVGAVEVSVVRFRPLDDREREAYLDSGDGKGSRGPTASRIATRSSRSSGAASRTSSDCRWNGSSGLLDQYPALIG